MNPGTVMLRTVFLRQLGIYLLVQPRTLSANISVPPKTLDDLFGPKKIGEGLE